MREARKLTVIFEAILCSLGLMVFSFFIQYKFPVRLISFSALLISAIIIARNLRSPADIKKITGENISLKITLLYTISGIGLVLHLRSVTAGIWASAYSRIRSPFRSCCSTYRVYGGTGFQGILTGTC